MKMCCLLLLIVLSGCNSSDAIFFNDVGNVGIPTPTSSSSLTYAIGSIDGLSNNATVSGPLNIPIVISGGQPPYSFSLDSAINSEIQDKTNDSLTWEIGNNTTGGVVVDTLRIVDAYNESVEITFNVSNAFSVANPMQSVNLNVQETIGQVSGGIPPYFASFTSENLSQSVVVIQPTDGLGYANVLYTAQLAGTETVVVTDSGQNSAQLTITSQEFFECPLDLHGCPPIYILPIQ
jgi:hypothetical protein